MAKRTRKISKNQKGFTLVELLAVIVILGIIAAIAVPSIGGIIDNTKKDAYIANAQQMVSGARMALAGGEEMDKISGSSTVKNSYTLKTLIAKGYIEPFTDPDTKDKYDDNDIDTDKSYVVIIKDPTTGNNSYEVKLVGAERTLSGSNGATINIDSVTRDNVK